jgi:hypothetical protein
MTDNEPIVPSEGAGFFSSLVDVIVSPREAFARLVAKPGFWLALLFNLVLAVAFTAIWMHKVDAAEFMKNQLIESGQWDKMPPENRGQVVEMQSRFFPVFAWLGALLGSPIAIFLTAGVLLFVYRFFYAGQVTFKQSGTIVAYVFAAYGLVTTPLMLLIFYLKNDWNLNPQEVIQANLRLLLDRESVSKTLWAFAGSIDLLSFWLIFMLAAGFGVALKRSTGSAAWGVIVPWAVTVLIKVAWTAAFAG